MKTRTFYLLYAVMLAIGTVGLLLVALSAQAAPESPSSLIWTDDFNSSALNGRWSWISEAPSHWSLTARPGFLRLTTQFMYSGLDNLLVQDAPAGDYEIQTRLFFTPTANVQSASLMVYQNNSNLLMLGRAYCNAPPPTCVGNGIYFTRIQGGLPVGGYFAMTTTMQSEAYLRMMRQGNVYTGYVSADGINWTLVGAHTASFAPNKVGLMATNQMQNVAEVSADFDFFTLIEDARSLFLPILLR